MKHSTEYQRANAALQKFKRTNLFRNAVGTLSRLAWKRRKAARASQRQLIAAAINQELSRL